MDTMTLNLNKIEEFSNFLYLEECALSTVKQYMRDLKRFYLWLPENKELNKEILIKYKNYLLQNYAAVSVNCKLSSINSFLDFAGAHNLKLKFLKIQKKTFANTNKELTKTEYAQLITKAEDIGNLRLSMIIQTIGSTGIRIGELKYITVDAVKKGKAEINMKGKVRIILITKKLKTLLLKYSKEKNIKNGPIFITKNRKPVDRSNIWNEMKKLCNLCKITEGKVFPHNIRHLFAKTFYEKSKDIIKLSDILGHSSINTTRIYTITNSSEHEKKLSQLGLLFSNF